MILSFSFYLSYSQELPTIVPPSPEAAALANFTDVPISHYTGLPNISVPIYTIQQKGIQIPINLSYHSRGVMVSETAPRTGMGWSLQYGGVISRQVRGKSDEDPGYGYLSNSQHFKSYPTSLATRQTVNSIETSNPDYDFYPDQFSFSAGSLSGKFILDYNSGNPIIQTFGDIEISYDMGSGPGFNSIGSFIITDANGTKYYFGRSKDLQRFARDYQSSGGVSIYNNNVVPNQTGSSNTAFSSWNLLDIETSFGELISYHYYSNNNASLLRKSYDKHDSGGSNITNSAANMSNINAIHTKLSTISIYEHQLAKISFNHNTDSIVFYKSATLRDDYDGYALNKVSVYHKNKLIKSLKLNYTYTSSTDQSNLLWYFQSNTFDKYLKRMFLSSIEEEDENGEKLPPYVFTYDSQILPSVFSSRQDYWGYYNGATNNGPFTRMFEYGAYKPDRRVNTLKSEAGLLKQIKYPTGGITKFTYEHNKGRIPFTMASLKLPQINPGSNDEMIRVIRKADFTYNASTGGYTPYTIQLPANTSVSYMFSCMHFTDANDPNPPPSCLFDFTLNNSSVNLGQNYMINTGSSTSSTIKALPKSWNGDPNLHLNNDIDFQITIQYDIPDDPGALLYGPGKRIQKIENISASGSSTFKEYEYNFPSDETLQSNGAPSGAIIGLPSYLNTAVTNGFTSYSHYNDATSAFSSFQPNGIGYSGVIEYHGTKENNVGKTEYLFTNISDSGGDYYEFPYHPPTDNEWLRGKNIRTKFFENNGSGNYTLIREVYNKYLYANSEYTEDFEFAGLISSSFDLTPLSLISDWEDSFTSLDTVNSRVLFKLPLFMRQGATPEQIQNSQPSGYRIYHLTGGTQHLSRTIEKDYFENSILEKTTTYDYNYDNQYQVSSSKITDSKGVTTLNKFYYPKDLNHTLLINQHRLSEVTKTESFRDVNNDGVYSIAEKRSEVNTLYKNWGNNVILPEFVQTSKGNNTLENRVVYKSYDNKGNPTELNQSNGIPISYVWGYNSEYLIAKVENATQAQIASLNLNTTILNDTNTSATELRTELNKLRTSLPNAMVTTYTYDTLIGVTSITDPRGNTVFYEYDNFNRLKYIKDANGKLVSESKYHYKGQQ